MKKNIVLAAVSLVLCSGTFALYLDPDAALFTSPGTEPVAGSGSDLAAAPGVDRLANTSTKPAARLTDQPVIQPTSGIANQPAIEPATGLAAQPLAALTRTATATPVARSAPGTAPELNVETDSTADVDVAAQPVSKPAILAKTTTAQQPEKCQWLPLEQALRGAGADNADVAQIQPVYDGLVAAGADEAAISSALTERFVTYIVPILANCAGATAAGPATPIATPPGPPAGGTGGGGGCDPRVASCN